ncbi:hypothetical protein [Phaeobacter sp.]|uniref:hypothetical protein n=1 Tax=Phaeobacter sp. TaxID=1902409 RepID=UPI0025F961B4|nr:hypothetical protein [Phaeobacter sp.]
MLVNKPVGRNAPALKYDILTAVGTFALSLDKGQQRLVLRFMTLLTARYNWQRNELAVGQREIANMWFVDERTVKREMAKLRGLGWLVVKRQGARGRVTEYGVDLERILEDTRNVWPAIGPDFDHRMQAGDQPPKNVVPLMSGTAAPAPDVSDGTEWSLTKAILHAEDNATYTAWIQALSREGRASGRLTLRAPSRFHANYVVSHLQQRLFLACQEVDPDINAISIIS